MSNELETLHDDSDIDESKVECAECGHIVDLVKEDAWVRNNLPACEKCKNKYWRPI